MTSQYYVYLVTSGMLLTILGSTALLVPSPVNIVMLLMGLILMFLAHVLRKLTPVRNRTVEPTDLQRRENDFTSSSWKSRKMEWISVLEAAYILGVSRKALYGMCDRGSIESQVLGRVVRVSRRDVERLARGGEPDLPL